MESTTPKEEKTAEMMAGQLVAMTITLASLCTLSLSCGSGPGKLETLLTTQSPAMFEPQRAAGLPPAEAAALEQLNSSPRHGEWINISTTEKNMPVITWIVYPERPDQAPIVLIIHEIYGLTDWIRGVADQLAAEGFIAVAPDLLSGTGPNGGGTSSLGKRDNVIAAIRTLEPAERTRRLNSVHTYALAIPAGNGLIGSMGFSWGGKASFAYALEKLGLNAAVVYYASFPDRDTNYSGGNTPVLGLYGEIDERVNSTISRAKKSMADYGAYYEPIIFKGAGHGFLRAQLGQEGANMRATAQAWLRTVEFLREHLDR